MLSAITVQTNIKASVDSCWQTFTSAADILQFNNPFPNWHTARVAIDFKEGGRFFYRMETKDGTEGFDFAGSYQRIIPLQRIELKGDDGRLTIHAFTGDGNSTTLTETFEPDAETPLSLQQSFCQNLLNSFKQYIEEKLI